MQLFTIWGASVLVNIVSRGIWCDDALEHHPVDAPMTSLDRILKPVEHTSEERVTLNLSLGSITGLKLETIGNQLRFNHKYYAFRNIPYAAAPVGLLRFSDPKRAPKWPPNGINGTEHGSVCPQFDHESMKVVGEEDCLNLNVYTPELPGKDKALLPVIVFIHGGAFLRGSGASHGASRLMQKNVILVTFNYRLGTLGFLSTGDSRLPGNYGMLDQVAALRWVNEHISEFGGDASRVTVGGFSAGAASVHLHLLSPLSKGLIHGALSMSGSADCLWAVQHNPEEYATLLANKLGCPVGSETLKSCVMNKSVHEVIISQAALHKYVFSPMSLAPVMDAGLRPSPFLPNFPDKLVPHTDAPVMMGTVPLEGLLFVGGLIAMAEKPEDLSVTYNEAAQYVFQVLWRNKNESELMSQIAESFYFSDLAKSKKDVFLEEISEGVTDYLFEACNVVTANNLVEAGNTVYRYMMTHRDPDTPVWASPLYTKLKKFGYDSSILSSGLSHGDDMVFLFEFAFLNQSLAPRDQLVSDLMVTMVVNFVTNGSPQKGEVTYENHHQWTPLMPGQPVGYFNISLEPSMYSQPLKIKESNFWSKTLPNVLQKLNSQKQKSLSPSPKNDFWNYVIVFIVLLFTHFFFTKLNILKTKDN